MRTVRAAIGLGLFTVAVMGMLLVFVNLFSLLWTLLGWLLVLWVGAPVLLVASYCVLRPWLDRVFDEEEPGSED